MILAPATRIAAGFAPRAWNGSRVEALSFALRRSSSACATAVSRPPLLARAKCASSRHDGRIGSSSLSTSAKGEPSLSGKPASLHREMENVMGKKTDTSSSSGLRRQHPGQVGIADGPKSAKDHIFMDPDRRKRYYQALFNAGGAFFVLLFSAQGLKSGIDKRKAEKKRVETEQMLEEKRDALKSLLSKETLRPVAQRLAASLPVASDEVANGDTMEPSNKGRGWFGIISPSSGKPRPSETSRQVPAAVGSAPAEEMMLKVLMEEMHRIVGDSAFTEKEREAYNFKEMQGQESGEQEKASPEDVLLTELSAAGNVGDIRVEEGLSGEKVVKKKIFSM